MSRRQLRQAYTCSDDVKNDRVREVIAFDGRFWGVFRWEGHCSPVETFTVYQLIAGEGTTWQQRRARTLEGSTTDIDGLQVTSNDGGHWIIRQAAALHVRCERAGNLQRSQSRPENNQP
jgi:hypothetical protein